MFSTIRSHLRLSPAGVIAVVALVFAMVGGAFAANDSGTGAATASKAKSKKGPPGPRGPKGATGPAGAQGIPGANGKDGAAGASGKNGIDGADGADGVSPVGTAFAGVKSPCTEGGVEFTGTNTTRVCNGVKGEPGPLVETLPSGKSMTGAWGFFEENAFNTVTISYPFKLASPAAVVFLGEGEGETTDCPGTAANPQAAAGKLCIYTSAGEGANFVVGPIGFPHSSVTGAFVAFLETTLAFGSWAVKAP